MTVKEFLNTCQMDWSKVCVYFDLDSWEDSIPDYEFVDMREARNDVLNSLVDAWIIEQDESIHILA